MVADVIFGGLFFYCTAAIAREDLRSRIVPDLFLAILFAAGLIYGLLRPEFPDESLAETFSRLAWRSALPGLFLLAVGLLYRLVRRREGLGLGDVKLSAAAGVWLPVMGSFYALTAAAVAALIAVAGIGLWRRQAAVPLHSLPFAVFLAPVFWLFWLCDLTGLVRY